MQRTTLCLSSFLLVAVLAAPAALRAGAAPSHSPQRDDSQRDDRNQGRIYDSQHRDWHDWNDNEDRAYRQYLSETHKDYREFTRLSDRDQRNYWNWRHSHPDRDDRGGRDDRGDRGDRPPNRDQDNRGNGQGRRYYDQNTGQYHDWNDNEDRAYRSFLDEDHRAYIDFDHADISLQLRFWLWRRSHPDNDDQGRRRFYDDNRREWHDWNDREESVYRSYLISIGTPYLEFSIAPHDLQFRYWAWRRNHPDPDDRGFRSYFDPGHNDWHVWDENEDRAYREFMRGRNWPYRDLSILLPRDQQRYFDWRHKHPDRDRDRR